MKFEIKSRWDGSLMFELECDSFRICAEAAVKSKVSLAGAYLAGANLACANLAGANLACADLACANLAGANLAGANLACAYLADANLACADLACANLAGANLACAYLADANLACADLACANLAGANLAGANLAGANLAGANLAGANLAGAKGCDPILNTDLLMLLDQPDDSILRAYKLVNQDAVGPFNGGIAYKIGDQYEVSDADTNPAVDCGRGINVATLPWCLREWRTGYRILLVEFLKSDIAAIPNHTDGKFRLHRCRVVGEKALDYEKVFPKKSEEESSA